MAEEMAAKDPYDFPLLSLEQADPAAPEAVFKEEDKSWKPAGVQLGTVEVTEGASGKAGEVTLTGAFTFTNGETVTVSGPVPKDKDGKVGPGNVRYVKGTGKFAGRQGPLRFEQKNPKRWG
jgi:hypothetical protein